MKAKRIIGIVLLVLQIIGTVSAIIMGDFTEMLSKPLPQMIGNLIGFFLIGIIGIILLIKSNK